MECSLCNLFCENPTFREKREEVKNFNKDIWHACKTFLSARIHHQHKYRDVVLPDRWNDHVIGYYSSCYKEFRVKSKYLSDIHLVDEFYLLHTLKNLPNRYDKISKHILKILTYDRKEVHIIFDKYKKPSITDYEHDLRDEEDTQYDIIRKDNNRPTDFCKLLRSNNFREKFVEFLIEDWTRDEFVLLITGKTVKLNYNQCYTYEVSSENKIKKVIDYNLSCYHEEADTKIVYHICQFNTNYRVQVHCTDSDIPVIMLANFKYLKSEIEIIINLSTSKKEMYLNINEIYVKLGDQLSCSLAICHIFTGNDYNPAFFRKGKKRPFSIFKKNKNFQEAFIELLQSEHTTLTTSNKVVQIIEEYVCRVYSLKTKNDINKGRYELFEKGYKSKNESEEILEKKIVGYDPSSLPPTKQELLQQIKRTVLISNVWCNAHMRCPTEKLPENYGWTIIDGKYEYYWFDGPHSPSFEELSPDSPESDITNEGDEDGSDGSSEEDLSDESD